MLYTHNQTVLRPARSDEFLPPVSRWTCFSGLFLVGTITTAITLAATIKYNVTVKAAATVRPAGELRLVQPEIEGTIKSIEVRENQTVKQGEAIARLDDSQLQLQKHQLQGNLQQSESQLTQIIAQVKTLDTQIMAESQLMARTIAAARAEVSRNQRDYQQQQTSTRAEWQAAKAAVVLARDEMSRYQQLVKTGVVSLLQFKQKESAYHSATAKLEQAKAALNPSAADVVIATEQIAQAQAKGESTLAALNKEREFLIQQQVEVHTQLSKHQTELQQIKSQLQKSFIRATSDGIILKLNLLNPGQVVQPGEAIAQITPKNAPLVIKAKVATQDIDRVATGQKVQMRVNACPYPDYGTLTGIVSAVSPDVVTPQGSNTSASAALAKTTQAPVTSAGTNYFEATIQPESFFLTNGKQQCQIQSGMEVSTDIISQEETVLQFLLRKARLLTDL